MQRFVVGSGFPEGAEHMSNTSRATPSSIVNGLWICCFSLSPDMVLASFLVYVCVYVYGITSKIGNCMDVAVDMALSDFGIVLLLVDE